MRKHLGYAVRGIIFLILVLVVFVGVNKILMPGFYYDQTWPTTTGYKGFYQMEKDSIDVLFLGSSHDTASFNPQILYDEYGIKSYNLGGEQQSMVMSYYWLKEGLRYQNPKAVVLDITLLFSYMGKEPLNCEETATRKSIDTMRWSSNKVDAVKSITNIDEKQTIMSFVFPNIRFHDRWEELGEDDFTWTDWEKHYELKGYVPLFNIGGDEVYSPYQAGDSSSYAEALPTMGEYLDKIVSLCKKEDIELILTATPSTLSSPEKYNSVKYYTDGNQLTYVDYNEADIYFGIGYDFYSDMTNDDHANVWGAEKLSRYMGQFLVETNSDIAEASAANIANSEIYTDSVWTEGSEYYSSLIADHQIKDIWDIYQYIDAITSDRYTVLMAVDYDATGFVDDALKQKFMELGISMDILPNGSYYASIADESISEGCGMEELVFHGTTRKGKDEIKITSAGGECPLHKCSIEIDGSEYSKRQGGLDIVVYSNITGEVLDSLWFTTGIYR